MGSADDDLAASPWMPILISLVGLATGVYQVLVEDANAANAVEHAVRVAGCVLLVAPIVWLCTRSSPREPVAWWWWAISAVALLAFSVMPVSFATHGETGWPEALDDGASILGAVVLVSALAAWLLHSHGRRARAHRRCPYCAETIRREAVLCRHCGSRSSVPPTCTTTGTPVA